MKLVDNAKAIHLKDYTKSNYAILDNYLVFELDPTDTIVANTMTIEASGSGDLELNGEGLELLELKINGETVNTNDYELVDDKLFIKNYPAGKFTLDVKNKTNPKGNTALDGLYYADDLFCTQNEPEGFRRITYYLDRPDNMAVFKTKIIADKETCPVLLSNGNLIDSGDLPGGMHYTVWEDPFKKPSYLFALVGGKLGMIEDSFKTVSGKNIDLKIYCDPGNEYKLHFAMESLKNSMKWDEQVYGLEYDLNNYMIVAVDSFNMGAMENKGLNIFNTACVMAEAKSQTDHDFHVVEGVIGHEYFHNWTGNRVTCRDWFQLTLKEGLTVFRDQEFSSDMSDRMVQRIDDVNTLRTRQFPEDLGPMAHPIRPRTYIEINNFYTATVYNKGAEIIRMVHTLLGAKGFRAGMDEYFKQHDGSAVTCEDFIKAMEDGGKRDFTHFRKWYDQKGVPVLTINESYDEQTQKYQLTLEQEAFDYQGEPLVLEIPLKTSLLAADGKKLNSDEQSVLILNEKKQDFVFENITQKPVLSLNQQFSAPVILKNNGTINDLRARISVDNDGFNRWDAAQELAKRKVLAHVNTGEELFTEEDLACFGTVIADNSISNALKAEILSLPSLGYLLQEQRPRNIEQTHASLRGWEVALAEKYEQQFLSLYKENHVQAEYKFEKNQVAQRRIKSCAMRYLSRLEKKEYFEMALEQYKSATNHTDEIFAFSLLMNAHSSDYSYLADEFAEKWQDDALVMDKWFLVQASSEKEDTLERVKTLLNHDKFEFNNPNKVRSLIGGFLRNQLRFNAQNGSGYAFLADMIVKLDPINPSMASALAGGFQALKFMDSKRQEMMQVQLNDIVKKPNLSKNTYEVVSKILGI